MAKKKKEKAKQPASRRDMKMEMMKASRLKQAALMLAEHQQAKNPKIKGLIQEVNQCRQEFRDLRLTIVALKTRGEDAGKKLKEALQPYIPEEFRDSPGE